MLCYESWGYVAGGLGVVLFLLSPWRQVGWQQRVVQWPGYTVKSVVETPRASFIIVERQGAISLIENGLQSGTTDDVATAEERVHYALLAHADPQRVLLLGACLGGFGEALKTPGVRVDIIEPDGDMIQAVQTYFPGRAQSLADPRTRLIVGDMRQEVRSCQQSYDVIILLAGEPLSLLTGRSYTRDFFTEVRHCLAPGCFCAYSVRFGELMLIPKVVFLYPARGPRCKQSFRRYVLFPVISIFFFHR